MKEKWICLAGCVVVWMTGWMPAPGQLPADWRLREKWLVPAGGGATSGNDWINSITNGRGLEFLPWNAPGNTNGVDELLVISEARTSPSVEVLHAVTGEHIGRFALPPSPDDIQSWFQMNASDDGRLFVNNLDGTVLMVDNDAGGNPRLVIDQTGRLANSRSLEAVGDVGQGTALIFLSNARLIEVWRQTTIDPVAFVQTATIDTAPNGVMDKITGITAVDESAFWISEFTNGSRPRLYVQTAADSWAFDRIYTGNINGFLNDVAWDGADLLAYVDRLSIEDGYGMAVTGPDILIPALPPDDSDGDFLYDAADFVLRSPNISPVVAIDPASKVMFGYSSGIGVDLGGIFALESTYGTVYVPDCEPVLTQSVKPSLGSRRFGKSLDIDGDVMVVGSEYHRNNFDPFGYHYLYLDFDGQPDTTLANGDEYSLATHEIGKYATSIYASVYNGDGVQLAEPAGDGVRTPDSPGPQGGKAMLLNGGNGVEEGLTVELGYPYPLGDWTFEITFWASSHNAPGNTVGVQSLFSAEWPQLPGAAEMFNGQLRILGDMSPTSRPADSFKLDWTALDNSGVERSCVSATPLEPQTWHTAAAIFDYNDSNPADSRLELYLNGEFQSSSVYDASSAGPAGAVDRGYGITSTPTADSGAPHAGVEALRFSIGTFLGRAISQYDYRGLDGAIDAVCISNTQYGPGSFVLPTGYFDPVVTPIPDVYGQITILERAAVGSGWNTVANFKSNVSTYTDYFARSVAVKGDTAAAWAAHHTTDSTELKIPVYHRVDGVWQHWTDLAGPDKDLVIHYFGDIAIDGSRIAASFETHSLHNKVHVFKEDGGVWSLEDTIEVPGGGLSEFGWSIALSGERLLIGAPYDSSWGTNRGLVYLYEFNGTKWMPAYTYTPHPSNWGDQIGWDVAIEGDVIVMGAPMNDAIGPNSGAAFVYEWDGDEWIETSVLTDINQAPEAHVGAVVDISGGQIITSGIGNLTCCVPSGLFLFEKHDGYWRSVKRFALPTPFSQPPILAGEFAAIDQCTVVCSHMNAGSGDGFVNVFEPSALETSSAFQFTDGAQAWSASGAPAVFGPIDAMAKAGALLLDPNGFFTFGFWQSPPQNLSIGPGEGVVARFYLESPVDRCLRPQVRLRALAEDLSQGVVAGFVSTGDCTVGPGGARQAFDLPVIPRHPGAPLILAVDMLNLDPLDAVAGAVRVDTVELWRAQLPVSTPGLMIRRFTFDENAEGWEPGGAAPVLTEPVFLYTGAGLRLTSQDNALGFGFWQTGNAGVFANAAMLRLKVRVEPPGTTAGDSVTVRARLFSGDNQFFQYVEEPAAAEFLTLQVLARNPSPGTMLDCGAAFDLLHFNPNAPSPVSVTLEEAEVLAFDLPVVP